MNGFYTKARYSVTWVMADSLWPCELYPASSSVCGILQARILEWVSMSTSQGKISSIKFIGGGELFVNVSNLIKTFDKRSHPFIDTGHSSQRRLLDFLGGASGKEPMCQCRTCLLDPWVRKIPWKRKWQPTSISLPGESHGQRNLAGYIP